jgi:hypothetical protein
MFADAIIVDKSTQELSSQNYPWHDEQKLR